MLITAHSATDKATSGLASIHPTVSEMGRGELNKASTWDDYPNGRFGDFKSPAYGNLDQWGGFGISVCAHASLLLAKAFTDTR